MGFIVLLAIAAVLGWLASIILRDDDGRSIAANVLVAMVGALLFATMVSGESMVLGISADALLAGVAGAVILVGAVALTRTRFAR